MSLLSNKPSLKSILASTALCVLGFMTSSLHAQQVFKITAIPDESPTELARKAAPPISYTLYRWENNIRAATVLGVVGAGGLGQMLSFHLSLFHMPETSTVLVAMVLLVVMVDGLSYASRRALTT